MDATTPPKPPDLRQWQALFRNAVLHGDTEIRRHIAKDGISDAHQRLAVYTEAYVLRLLEVLQDDFSALHTLLGERHFNRLACAYIGVHPSPEHSVRRFGCQFASFLGQHRIRPAWIRALADFEWRVGEVLDAADEAALTAPELAAVPQSQWPDLRLALRPAVQLGKWAWNAPQLLQAAESGAPASSTPHREPHPRWWLIWRQGLEARWRQLDKPEAWALRALQRGESLAALGSRLQQSGVPQGQVPAQLVTCLQHWLAAGLIRAISPT